MGPGGSWHCPSPIRGLLKNCTSDVTKWIDHDGVYWVQGRLYLWGSYRREPQLIVHIFKKSSWLEKRDWQFVLIKESQNQRNRWGERLRHTLQFVVLSINRSIKWKLHYRHITTRITRESSLLKADQVLVKVRASSINVDCLYLTEGAILGGIFGLQTNTQTTNDTLVLGSDFFAGFVEAVGSKVGEMFQVVG